MTNEPGMDLLVPLLHGFLDSCPPEYVVESLTWDGYFSQLLDLVWQRHASPCKAVRSAALIVLHSNDRTHFTSILSERLAKSSVESVSYGTLTLASELWSLVREGSEGYVGAVIDHAMQWAVRRFSDGSRISESDTALLGELSKFWDVRTPHQLIINLSRLPRSTNKECKGSPGRTCDCIRDQVSYTNSRSHFPMHDPGPVL